MTTLLLIGLALCFFAGGYSYASMRYTAFLFRGWHELEQAAQRGEVGVKDVFHAFGPQRDLPWRVPPEIKHLLD